jgi:hypothetical protein
MAEPYRSGGRDAMRRSPAVRRTGGALVMSVPESE